MARLSFTIRKGELGGSAVQQVSTGHQAAGDSDMALRADDFIYAVQPLGPTLDAGAAGEDDGWIEAVAIDYATILVRWRIPIELDVAINGQTLTALRLVYSDEGTPRAVSDGQTLATITKDHWADEHLHEVHDYAYTLSPFAYYSLFGRMTDGASVWYERLASLSELVPADHGSHDDLWRRIPLHFRLMDEELALEQGGAVGPLQEFLDLFGFELDRHRTLIQQLWRVNDPDFTHEQALSALAQQVGLHVDINDIPAKFLRNILANYGFLRGRKGTLVGAMAYLNALTECNVTALRGDRVGNLLSANVASMETDVSGWTNLSNATVTRSISTTPGHWASHGSASLRLYATANGGFSAGTARGTAGRPVTPGVTYTVRADVRPSISLRVRLYLTWFNASGGVLSDSVGAYTDVPAAPTALSYAATAPADAAFVSVQVQVETAVIDDTLRVDAVDLNIVGRTTFRDPEANSQTYLFMLGAQRINLIPIPRFQYGPGGSPQIWVAYDAAFSTAGLDWDPVAKTLTNNRTTGSPARVSIRPTSTVLLNPGVPYYSSLVMASAGQPLTVAAHDPRLSFSTTDPYVSQTTTPLPGLVVTGPTITSQSREVSFSVEFFTTTSAPVDAWPVLSFTLAEGASVTLDRWILQPFQAGPYFDGNSELGGFINDNTGNIAKDHRWVGNAGQSVSVFTEYLSHKRAAVFKSLDFIMPALFTFDEDPLNPNGFEFLFNALPGDAERAVAAGTWDLIAGRWPVDSPAPTTSPALQAGAPVVGTAFTTSQAVWEDDEAEIEGRWVVED